MPEDAHLGSMQRHLHDAYQREGLAWAVHLDLTYRCDLDCRHCYLDDKQWPELSTAEYQRLLHQLAEARVLDLRWSGGEVFLRPDFLELLALAAQLGFSGRIKTHAGNVTAERAAVLASCGIHRVDVSVYSLRAEIHDAFVRRDGALARTLAGIDHLRAAGLAVRIAMPVQPATIEEIPALHAHFRARGCEVGFSTRMFQDHSGKRVDSLHLSSAEVTRAETLIRIATDTTQELPLPISAAPERGPCAAGRSMAYIAPDGAVWPCVMFPMPLGNVRDKPFAEIWASSAERKALVAFTNAERGSCQSCAGSGLCLFCPGEAYKTSGDFRVAPPAFHASARARMAAVEQTSGRLWSEAQWASVPAPSSSTPSSAAKFPIYRPQKGRGRRVPP